MGRRKGTILQCGIEARDCGGSDVNIIGVLGLGSEFICGDVGPIAVLISYISDYTNSTIAEID